MRVGQYLRWSVAAGLVWVASALDAQEALRPVRGTLAGAGRPIRAVERDSASLRVNPTLRIDLTPGEFRVLQVPVPTELPAGDSVRYVATVRPGFRLIGRTSGGFRASASLRELIFTVSVADGVFAGEQSIGDVQFVAGDVRIVVPLVAQVTSVYATTAHIEPGRLGVRPAERFVFAFSVMNRGNVVDTLALSVRAPAGWGVVRPATAVVVLQPGARERIEYRGTVPTTVSPGDQGLSVELTRPDGSTAGDAGLILSVDAERAARRTAGAPILSVSTASVFAPGLAPLTGSVLALRGPVWGSARVDAQTVLAPRIGGALQRGAARTGLVSGARYVRVFDERWSAGLGPTLVPTSTLTGFNTAGDGVDLTMRIGAWQGAVGAARPFSPAGDGSRTTDPMIGVVLDGRFEDSTAWTISASHLRDRSTVDRALDAAGVTHERMVAGQRSRLGLAYRATSDARGLGVDVGTMRVAESYHAELNYTTTPGGSAAFARASDELLFTGGFATTSRAPWRVSMFRVEDATGDRQAVRTYGLQAGPSIRLAARTTLDIGASLRAFERDDAIATSGLIERNGLLSLQHSVERVFISLGATGGAVTQTLRPVGGPSADASASRFGARATVLSRLPFAVVSAQASLDEVGPGAGFAANTRNVTGRISDVPLGPFGRFAVFHAEAGWMSAGGVQRPMTTAILGLRLRVTDRYVVRIESERNPVVIAGSGARSPWVTAVQVTSDLRLPSVSGRPSGVTGVVYQDLNGNGVRDAKEPGFAGVVLRRGSSFAVTDREGRYEFHTASSLGEMPVIDQSTIPLGWVLGRQSSGRSDWFGVVPAGRLEVEVSMQPDALGRVVSLPDDGVVVVATDVAGRQWRVVPKAGRRARFDALPPGDYRVSLELIRLMEPVDLSAATAEVTVDPSAGASEVVLPLRPRPVRIFIPPGRQGGQGGQSGQTTPVRAGGQGPT